MVVKQSSKYRLTGATIVETLAAMTIVVFAFTLGTMVYTNVLNTDKTKLKAEVRTAMHDMAIAAKQQIVFTDTEVSTERYAIEQRIVPIANEPHLRILELEARSSSGQLLATHREIIINE